jgi:polyphosphate glucokinase
MSAIESSPRLALGIDIGGTGIKGAPVNLGTGMLATSRAELPTPAPSSPAAVAATVVALLDRIGVPGPVGLTLPAVVAGGITRTAANIDKRWIGVDAAGLFAEATGRMVRVVNDADAAGVAEMRFGSGAGRSGVVLMVTLGTGIGSALFVDGTLVPNTELGHLPLHGDDAERWAAGSELTRAELSWPAYASRVELYLRLLQNLFWPDLIIVGGGVSSSAASFLPLIEIDTPLVAATLYNDAGIVGAAMVAPERPPMNVAAPRAQP